MSTSAEIDKYGRGQYDEATGLYEWYETPPAPGRAPMSNTYEFASIRDIQASTIRHCIDEMLYTLESKGVDRKSVRLASVEPWHPTEDNSPTYKWTFTHA